MQRLGIFSAALIAAATFGAAASAGQPVPYRAETQRLDATPAALERAVVGATWRCEADRCVGAGGERQDVLDDCRRVSSAIGPLAAYSAGGAALKPHELAACNRMAGKTY
jgi:hypothetical protein